MRGDTVIVKSFGDKPLIRKVWDVSKDVVFICNDENFETLIEGNKGLLPVGFHKDDVFRYNPNIDINDPALWKQLRTYV